MGWTQWALLILVLWTGAGCVSIALAALRRNRRSLLRWAGALLAVWTAYLLVVVAVSLHAGQRRLALGDEQCFGSLCFAVMQPETLPGFRAANGVPPERLVRVPIRITNRDTTSPASEPRVRVYLLDAQGRSWQEIHGLSGVRLTARVSARGRTISQPVFAVAADATGLSLVLTRGRRQPGVLEIGDPDSLLHDPALVDLAL